MRSTQRRAEIVRVNRAPVLTLWATVVAERLGHGHQTALTLGKAVAGMNAQSKGKKLGIYPDAPESKTKETPKPARAPKGVTWVELLGRRVPVRRVKTQLRAVRGDTPEEPATIARYLESKLGEALASVEDAMRALAKSMPKKQLAARAFELYEQFRPAVPAGERGWGAKGNLDLAKIRALAD